MTATRPRPKVVAPSSPADAELAEADAPPSIATAGPSIAAVESPTAVAQPDAAEAWPTITLVEPPTALARPDAADVEPATVADQPAPPRALRLAHRGDLRRAPENTIDALLAAMSVPGCDGVEFDVRLSREGVPVLLHDRTLSRIQHRSARVNRLTVAELAEAGIPTLQAALDVLPPAAFLDVELKGDDHGAATAEVLLAARGAAPGAAVISSLEPLTLAAMADLLPGWPLWLNARDLSPATISLAVGLGCRGISALWGAITPASLQMANEAGLEVAAWTVLHQATFERLSGLGVVAACVEAEALDG